MKALTFLIQLNEPVLATQPYAGETNSAQSFLYVPGSMLRGALIYAYQRGKNIEDLLVDDQAWQLFFSQDVKFLNAYLAHPRSKKRLLPTPRSWFVEKEDATNVEAKMYDFAVGLNPEIKKPKPPEGGKFALITDDNAELASPGIQMTVHNTSEDRSQKKAGLSQVYRYEALAAGQVLAGVILVSDENLLNPLKTLLENEQLLLGGSHSGGYGSVTITDCKIQKNWREYEPGAPSNGITILTLLSDAILRGKDGHYSTVFPEAIGVDGGQKSQAFQDLSLVGGFNQKWGLPLPQSWALSAGSVFCFPTDAFSSEKLKEIVEQGIGERRNEGFGRVAVNWHTQPEYLRAELPLPLFGPPPTLSPASDKLLREMVTRRLRIQLDKNLVTATMLYRGRFQNLPKAAQLSRLRVVARTALLTRESGKITQHLTSLKDAKNEWMNARIGDQVLYEWVSEYSQLPEEKFREVFSLTADLGKIGNAQAELTQGLMNEYNLRLVDGVMKLAIEYLKSENDDGGGA